MYQKYILGLLDEYDGLLKRQLEFMTKFFVESHLRNIDGYLEQLKMLGRIVTSGKGDNQIITLPGRAAETDVIEAVDVMLEFAEGIKSYRRGHYPIAVQFYLETDDASVKEVNVYPIRLGTERDAVSFTERITAKRLDQENERSNVSWIFLVCRVSQMRLINPDIEYLFAMRADCGIKLYEPNK